MKVLHTADWHLGQFKGPVENGINLRSLDTEVCLDQMVLTAGEEKPDLVCVSGDIFHQEQIGPQRYSHEVLKAASVIERLADVAKFVVVMRGTPNHDGSGQFKVLTQLLSHRKNVEVVIAPQVIATPIADIACIPGFDKQEFRAKFPGLSSEEENHVWTEQISSMVMMLRVQCREDVPSILMAHYTVPGCNMESGQFSYTANFEPVIPREAIQAANFEGVFLGHIHKPQQLDGLHNVYYSGAVNMLNFNDEGQVRGFRIHEFKDGILTDSRFIETPFRQFHTITWDSDDVQRYLLEGKDCLEDLKDVVTGKIVRIRYSCNTDQRKALNIPLLQQDLYTLGAFYVSDIEAESMIDVTNRGLMKEESDPLVNLKKWLDEKCFKDSEKIVDLAEPIIAAAQKENVTAEIHGVFKPVSIAVKNYRNYKDEQFDFSDISFCTINGVNGAGKSSLFMDAIVDALYEETREGDNTSWIRATDDTRSGSIEFIFDIGEQRFRVVRTRVKSGRGTLNLSQKDGEEWLNLSKERIYDTQDEIERVLGMDSMTFRSCALIMQDQYGLFLQAKKDERISILGNLLGLGIYNVMERGTVQCLRDAKKDLMQAKDGARIKQEMIDSKGKPDEELEEIEADIGKHTDESNSLNQELRNLQQLLDAKDTIRKQIVDKSKQVDILTDRINSLSDGITAQNALIEGCEVQLAGADEIREGVKRFMQAQEIRDQKLLNHMNYTQAKGEIYRADEEIASVRKDIESTSGENEILEFTVKQKRLSIDQEGIDKGLKELAAVREALEDVTGKQMEDLRIRSEHAQKASELVKKTEEIRHKLNLAEKAMQGYETSKALISDSGCINIKEARCRFLAKAKEDVSMIPDTLREIEELKEELKQTQEEGDANIASTEERLKENGYDMDRHNLLKEESKRLAGYEDLAKQAEAVKAEISSTEARIESGREILDRYRKMLQRAQERLAEGREKLSGLEDDEAAYQEAVKTAAEYQDYPDKEKGLPVIEERMKNAEIRKKELEQELPEVLQEKAKAIEDMSEAMDRLKAFDGSIEEKKTQVESQLAEITRQIESLQITKGSLLQKIEDVKRLKEEVDVLKEQVDEAAARVSRYEALKMAFSQDGVPHQIIRNIIPHITDTANNILGAMTGGTMGVEFVMEKTVKGKDGEKATLDVLLNEYGKTTLPYSSKSGGEKVKASLAVILALAEIKTGTAGIQLGMLFIDEPPFLDDDGTQAYVDALETIRDRYPDVKVMAITHDDAMKARFTQSLTVIKTEDGSKVIY